MGRPALALVVSAALAALLAPAASASLWLTFSTTRAPPGTVVTARTFGRGSLAAVPPDTRLRVFLVRAGEQDVTSPADRRLVPLGELTVDARGNGRLRFEVPDVAPGDYTTYTHCPPCAASSAGRELLPTGPERPFVVAAAASGAGSFRVWPVVLGVAGAAALAGLGWAVRRATTRC